jgi:hypothetical protein
MHLAAAMARADRLTSSRPEELPPEQRASIDFEDTTLAFVSLEGDGAALRVGTEGEAHQISLRRARANRDL